jgi:hypothetical protein
MTSKLAAFELLDGRPRALFRPPDPLRPSEQSASGFDLLSCDGHLSFTPDPFSLRAARERFILIAALTANGDPQLAAVQMIAGATGVESDRPTCTPLTFSSAVHFRNGRDLRGAQASVIRANQ